MRIRVDDHNYNQLEGQAINAMFHRVLSQWVGDLLHRPPEARWPEAAPEDDYRNRDWRLLYRGSILDD